MTRYRMTITVDLPCEVFHKHLSVAGRVIANAYIDAPAGTDSLLMLLGLAVMPPDYRDSWVHTGIPKDLRAFIPVGECVKVEEVDDG